MADVLSEVGPAGALVLTTRVALAQDNGPSTLLSFGELLTRACAGETAGLHMLVGYFAHDAGRETGRLFSPDAITRAEVRDPQGDSRSERSSMSLAYGELRSDASALAIQSWYWCCFWHAMEPTQAANWRTALLAKVTSDPKQAQVAIDNLAGDAEYGRWLQTQEEHHHDAIAQWRNLANRCRYARSIEAASRLLALFVQRLAEVRCGAPADGKGIFHPKVYVVERGGDNADTVVLVGSGNWSASALNADPEHGNTELGVAYRVPGRLWEEASAISASNGDEHVAARLAATSKAVFAQVARPLASWMDSRSLMTPSEVVKATFVAPLPVRRPSEQAIVEPFAFNVALQFLRNLLAESVGSGQLAPLQGQVLAEIAPYQEKGAERLVALMAREGGAILADSTGLGKTWIAMRIIDSHLQTCHEPAGAVVIVVPNSTEQQWRNEVAGQGLEAVGGRFGAGQPCIRVVTHGALQRLALDKDHLALIHARLVIVDEAHNFRNENSARWRRLRALLSLVPANGHSRQVLLMTATPINNSLDDIRSLVALIKIPKTELRVPAARAVAAGTRFDALGLSTGRPTIAPFDLDDDESERLRNLDSYFAEEGKKLEVLSATSVEAASSETSPRERILDKLLRRLVVRRNREQCIELDKASQVTNLRFRKPRPTRPESIRVNLGAQQHIFEDLLRLFQSNAAEGGLTLAVHRWDMTAEADSAGRATTLLALQRVLLLKRLESSTMALLQSLLRLIGLHVWRLDHARSLGLLRKRSPDDNELARIGSTEAVLDIARACRPNDVFERMAAEGDALSELNYAYGALQRASADGGGKDLDDVNPESEATAPVAPDAAATARALLVPTIIAELGRLVEVTGAFLVRLFGGDRESWPQEMMRREGAIWPNEKPQARLDAAGQDPKVRALIGFLAREIGQGKRGRKVVVFTQFGDTMHELRSVFEALSRTTSEAQHAFGALCGLDVEGQRGLAALAARVAYVSSATGDDDLQKTLQRFAPYYQIGPKAPPQEAGEAASNAWRDRWLLAARDPVDVLITTDVLSEGVNLQDVTTLVHFDLHWNPVRMVQRAGRIDRRLKDAVEDPPGGRQVDLEDIFKAGEVPVYAWTLVPNLAPRYVNFLLPEKLDDALSLCLTLARKGLAIQSTVGVDCDLGLPGDELEKALRFQIVGPSDFRPLVGATEEAAMTLAKADKYLRNASGLESGGSNFVVLRHPKAKAEDPFVVRATWKGVGDAVAQSATGWLRPTGKGARSDGVWYPEGAAKTIAGEIVSTSLTKRGLDVDRKRPASPQNLLQLLTLRQRQHLVAITAEAQRDPRAWAVDGLMWEQSRAEATARSLIWAVRCRKSSADESEITAYVANKRMEIERFEALQLPMSVLEQVLKAEVKS